MILGETEKADEVLTVAKEQFNLSFDLYNVNTLDFSDQYKVPYKRGYPVDCDSIGSMINALRKKANLSMTQLCKGIYSKSSLQRIEHEVWVGNYFNLEAIMQRLGRDISLYNNFFLSKKEFTALQLRDRTFSMIIEQRYTEALLYIKEFELLEGFTNHNVNKQFIETAKTLIKIASNNEPLNNLDIDWLEALKITCPDFEVHRIDEYNLTYNEVFIINQYASSLGRMGRILESIDIYERLIHNLTFKYVDEFEKSRMFSTLLFNCSSALGRLGRRSEALLLISDAESFERRHNRLIDLPGILYNKAYNLFMLGKEKESFSYFVLAYYGTSMFANYGQASYLSIICADIKRLFGYTLD